MYRYTAILEPDPESGYVVRFPDLPFGITQGETVEECLDRAQEVVLLVLEELISRRQPVPKPKKRRGRLSYSVELPALVEAKLELYTLMREDGVSKAELGRRLGSHPMQIERLLDLRHKSHLQQLEAAFKALGRRLLISCESAA